MVRRSRRATHLPTPERSLGVRKGDDGAVRSSPSSEWLNHATGGVKTEDIFARRRRRGWKPRLAALIGGGLALAGRGVTWASRGALRAGRFSFRQMQPMRLRDWVTVAALLAVLIAMGAYMAFENRPESSVPLPNCRWYVVQPGDTLTSIARENGVSVTEIAHANGVFDVDDPEMGRRLCLPDKTGVAQAAPGVPPASHTDGPVIKGEAAYVRFVLPFARQAHDATGWPVSVILAQWGLEQGWRTPTFTGYNFGNCGGLVGEPFIPGTAVPGSPSTFAYADTPDDGLRFYIHVAHLPFYDQIAPAARKGGPVAAARALGASPWDAGHYTDHNDPGSKLVALMQRYNLQQFD